MKQKAVDIKGHWISKFVLTKTYPVLYIPLIYLSMDQLGKLKWYYAIGGETVWMGWGLLIDRAGLFHLINWRVYGLQYG